ncbi:hypothetical protein TCE0_033r08057 [Talaromyces pinophilus]|uniref:Glutamine amidotransferase domain-containing protein n=1 Tax=Talaromyces pinophilus TaxID=128442 RepID=A0A6V8H8U2_TALPI|nr:Hypothetical protein PENO1_099000 [Penicillium occitanis (nom. inval.)]PCG90920.1 hypothetical protein PENOC_099710 [Penicillium occitanis (nom. inval.)]GAM37818.1 hypothetical protein TCE0_033r08057 [Talaromyces pinophilus]
MGSIDPSVYPPAIRLGIFECGTPLPLAKKRYGTYGGMFEALFAAQQSPKAPATERKITFSKYQVDCEGAEYPDLSGVDVILITGSKHSAYLDVPWINKLVSVISCALQTPHIKVIGLNDKGWETAVLPVELAPAGKALLGKDQLNLQFSHQDIVASCPPGVENLGSTPRCAVQGMYQRGNFISFQGHPEFNEEVIREILVSKQADGLFGSELYEDSIKRASLEHDGLLVGRLFSRFILEDTL